MTGLLPDSPERRQADARFQADMRRRHAAKFPRLLAADGFRFPDSLSAEQATADAVAQARWQALSVSGLRVLDLTCGLGCDTFHAAMAGARVTAVELDPRKAEAARGNAAALGLADRVTVVGGDSLQWLRDHPDERFDLIFADPARRADGTGRRLYALDECSPDIPAALPLLLARAPRLVVKASPMLDIAATRRTLGAGCDIELVGTPADCRELVATLPGTGALRVTTVMRDGSAVTVAPDDTSADAVPLASPAPGMLLFEPYPAMMKAGCAPWLCRRYGLTKIAPDTHLYLLPAPAAELSLSPSPAAEPSLSPSPAAERLPGHLWRIDEVMPTGSAAWKRLRGIAAQTAVRGGFPMTADALRKKIGAAESDTVRLYGLRDASAAKLLLLCSRP